MPAESSPAGDASRGRETGALGAGRGHAALDLEFTRLAIRRGWLSEDAARDALGEVDRSMALGFERTVDEVLLARGVLNSSEVKTLRETLGWSLPATRVGDYEIVRRIGLGGMGVVFEARHVRLGQKAALKVLYPRLAANHALREMLFREARTLAKLHHPNLVHPMDVGSDGDYCYLALELVEGEDLLQRLMRRGPLAPDEALSVVRDVLRALGALEKRRLIHGDVKPSNILVDPGGNAKLTDLGLLRRFGPLPSGRRAHGTPHYLAPEVLRGGEVVDTRGDLYALGATWYHLLCGRPPFQGRTPAAIFRCHLAEPPPGLVRDDVPEWTASVIARLLEKEPEARPAGCAALLEEVEARQPRRLPRDATTVGRRRVCVLVCVLVTLVGGLAWWWGALRDDVVSVTQSEPPDAGRALEEIDRATLRLSEEGDARRASEGEGEGGAGPQRWRPLSRLFGEVATRTASVGESLAGLAGAAFDVSAILWNVPSGQDGRPAAGAAAASTENAPTQTARVSEATGLQEPSVERMALEARRAVLARTFHAAGVDWLEGDYGVRLEYDFAEPVQLADFRVRPGVWRVASAAARSRAGAGEAELATLAWFRLPIRVDATTDSAALRVTFGGEELLVRASAGRVQVLLHAVDVMPLVEEPGVKRLAPPPEVSTGRVELFLPAGSVLSRLRVEGELDAAWARVRFRIAERNDR